MRGVGVLVAALVAGCSRPNPLFVVASDGASGGATAAETETGTGTGTGGVGDSTGSTGAVAAASTSDETEESTTTGMSTAASTGDGTSTGDGASSTGDGSSSTGGESSSSGGEEEEELLAYDLWQKCPGAVWTSSQYPLVCSVGPPPPAPWAGQLFELFEGEVRVLAEVPYAGKDNVVSGIYTGLTLKNANSPRLRAVVVCPGPGACTIEASIWAEVGDVKAVWTKKMTMDEHAVIDVDLGAVNDGVPFDIVMTTKSLSDAPSNKALWVRPRIVALP